MGKRLAEGRFRNIGVGGKISSFFFSFSVLILLVFYLYNRFFTYPMLADEELEKMDDIALLMRDDIRVALEFESMDGVEESFRKSLAVPGMLHVALVGGGQTLLSVGRGGFHPEAEVSAPVPLQGELEGGSKGSYFRKSYPLDTGGRRVVLCYSAENYLEEVEQYDRFTLGFVFFLVLSTLFFSVLANRFFRPLSRLGLEMAKLDGERIDEIRLPEIPGNDERGLLIRSAGEMLERLRKSMDQLKVFNQELERRVEEKSGEVIALNQNLQARVEEELKKNREKDHLLIQQSRLAAMGEMIGNIAHQWRQPLNATGLILQKLLYFQKKGVLDQAKLEESVEKGMSLVEKMSTTIDDFRHFFNPGKIKVRFDLVRQVKEASTIYRESLAYHRIDFHLEGTGPVWTVGHPGEFSQVLLNLISNAKDAVLASGRKDGKVTIRVEARGNKGVVRVEDNGPGIPEEVKEKVFDPYFTTKEEGKGTGIGLYMSKMIVEEQMGGKILAENRQEGGAAVSIVIPLADETEIPPAPGKKANG